MKKLLLSLAVLTAAGNAFADNYIVGDPISATELASMQGEHKVIFKVITKTTTGFLHPLVNPGNAEQTFFASKDLDKTLDGEFTEDYVYTINVDSEGKFTILNANGAYAPVPTANSTSVYAYNTATTEADAVKFSLLSCITTASISDHYMLQAASVGTSGASHLEVHFDGTSNALCYYATGALGQSDAGGLAGNGDTSRTAAAIMMYKARSLAFPMADTWYRLKSQCADDTRHNTCLSYYPETPWYVFGHSTGTRDNKLTNEHIAASTEARMSTPAEQTEIDGQLWMFIEGEDENAGKYCLVNKSYPEGAISNVIYHKNGGTTTTADNSSRWKYVANRAETPAEVCWFDLSTTKTINNVECVNFKYAESGNCYMGFAVGGNQYQLMRNNNASGDDNFWMPERYVEESVEDAYAEGIAALHEAAHGFAAMKAVINNEECPDFSSPEGLTAATLTEKITEANTAYQAYINKFNGKTVTIKNNRRADRNQNPWLAIYMRNGAAATNTLAEVTDDAKWLLVVENNKVRFHNLTTGFQLRANLMIPQAVDGGVRFQINSTANYLNIDTQGSDAGDYSVAADLGSIWTLDSSNYAFCQPEVSTAAAPKYYRILSDRWMTGKGSPAFAINGENRDASGEGEQISKAQFGHSGAYWRMEAGENEGTVKIYNLVDGYAIGRTANNSNIAAMRENDAAEFYLINLENTPMANGTNFNIANSYAISSTETIGGTSCLDASANNAKISEWSPLRSNSNNFEDNGSLWYFILASDDEVAAATSNYIAAVTNRLPNNDTENITALVGKDAAKEYAAKFDTESDPTTINGVNQAKRTGNGLTEIVYSLLDQHIVGQHIQLSTAVGDQATKYLTDNGTAVAAITDASDIATLWTIAKGQNGYTFLNEATGRSITLGNDSENANFPTSDSENYEFAMTFNPQYGKFAIHKQGSALSDRRAIHLTQDGRILKWSASGITNSHWYISSLADADFEVTYDQATSQYQLTIGGEITDHAISQGMEIVITAVEDEETPASRTAVANGGKTITISAAELQNATDKTILLPAGEGEGLVCGKYTISVPGAMMTVNGQHTRATTDSFTVNEDGSVTGIAEVAAPAAQLNGACFDLQGRRVMNPTRKGIYIINGRKVMVK